MCVCVCRSVHLSRYRMLVFASIRRVHIRCICNMYIEFTICTLHLEFKNIYYLFMICICRVHKTLYCELEIHRWCILQCICNTILGLCNGCIEMEIMSFSVVIASWLLLHTLGYSTIDLASIYCKRKKPTKLTQLLFILHYIKSLQNQEPRDNLKSF